MTKMQFRAYLVQKIAKITKSAHSEDEAAFEHCGELQFIVDTIDGIAQKVNRETKVWSVYDACNWVGEPYLVDAHSIDYDGPQINFDTWPERGED